MVGSAYTPEKGDLIWLNFAPQSGHEQSGTRPALVLSPAKYNKKTGLLIACPLTSKRKGYPFEVSVETPNLDGVILSDHVKNLDWRSRKATFIEKASKEIVQNVLDKLLMLIQ